VDYHFLLTFDVEDWFQVENFKSCIPFSAWGSCELRVEKNVNRILDLLDSITLEPQVASCKSQVDPHPGSNALSYSRSHEGLSSPSLSATSCEGRAINHELSANHPQATFFILGWIAERLPHLVREIHRRGHEIASHGYNHQLCHLCSDQELREDLVKSKKLLEDLVGVSIRGYRAPSFSVNTNLLKILEAIGYIYDSSFNSFEGNSRYGKISLKQNGDKEVASTITNNFYELPISNLTVGSKVFPMGGGGYFRLIPFPLFSEAVKAILHRQKTYVFYLHPWEIDPEQPRVKGVSKQFRFRHYHNLKKTEERLFNLIRTFKDCHFITCGEYISRIKARV
jgi:polysaccharide deacetylase family protein (PEP-CTERM system associated)